jgi:hypothetical protein
VKARWEYEPRTREWVLATWTPDGDPIEVFGAMPAGALTAIPAAVRRRVAEAAQERYGKMPPARVFDGPPGEQVSMTCPLCWSVSSWNPSDAGERYCGRCHAWPEVDEKFG